MARPVRGAPNRARPFSRRFVEDLPVGALPRDEWRSKHGLLGVTWGSPFGKSALLPRAAAAARVRPHHSTHGAEPPGLVALRPLLASETAPGQAQSDGQARTAPVAGCLKMLL